LDTNHSSFVGKVGEDESVGHFYSTCSVSFQGLGLLPNGAANQQVPMDPQRCGVISSQSVLPCIIQMEWESQ
jgi:hypothetical protein